MTQIPFHLQLPDIGLGGGLALWGFRVCAMGGARCPLTVRGFEEAFGAQGVSTMASVLAFTRSIGTIGRRKIGLSQPCCRHTTADELSIIAAMAAAQNRDTSKTRAHLGWLLADCVPQDLVDDLYGLVDVFSRFGMQIKAPEVEVVERASARPGLILVDSHQNTLDSIN